MAYSEAQLDRYLAHVSYPRPQHDSDPHRLLTELTSRQVARVPFENLSLHYSAARTLSLGPQDLFRKVVERGTGGYCMELSALFGEVLRGLGFEVLAAGARVMGGDGRYQGWNHMVNIVTVAGRRYLVDVGFGKGGPTVPVPLEDGHELVTIAPTWHARIEHRRLTQHTDPGQRAWVYLTRDDNDTAAAAVAAGASSAGWKERYCFLDVEFFAADFELMNFVTMRHPESFFAKNLMAVRMILSDGTDDAVVPGSAPEAAVDSGTSSAVGVLVLFNSEVKRTLHGKTEVLQTLRTEAERVAALEKYFDVVLTSEEAASITGSAAELRGGSN